MKIKPAMKSRARRYMSAMKTKLIGREFQLTPGVWSTVQVNNYTRIIPWIVFNDQPDEDLELKNKENIFFLSDYDDDPAMGKPFVIRFVLIQTPYNTPIPVAADYGAADGKHYEMENILSNYMGGGNTYRFRIIKQMQSKDLFAPIADGTEIIGHSVGRTSLDIHKVRKLLPHFGTSDNTPDQLHQYAILMVISSAVPDTFISYRKVVDREFTNAPESSKLL